VEESIRTAYVLFLLSLLIFFMSHTAAVRLKASGDRRIVEAISKNIAEVALIFAIIAGAYSLVSFVLTSIINSSSITLAQVKRFDEFLEQSRQFWKKVELTTWCFVGLLLLLAPITLFRIPERTNSSRHLLLQRAGRLAFHTSNALRRYRKLHKWLTIALAFAVSFTFLPGMNRGDMERLTAARLKQAGKQIAEVDNFFRKTVATGLAHVIVDRSFAALPPNYRSEVWKFPDGARNLNNHVRGLEGYYKISLTSLHQKVAPLIGRFQQSEHYDRPTAPPIVMETSAILLTQALADDGNITFGEVERVAVRVQNYRPHDNRKKDNLAEPPSSERLPAEIVEEVTSELLSPKRFIGSTMVEAYPWLEPLLEVLSDATAKIVSGKPFEVAWRPIARLFEQGKESVDDQIFVSIESRVAELSIYIEPDPSVVGDHAVLDVVVSDGLALDELWEKVNTEQSRAYAALLASNKAKLESLQQRFAPPRDPGPGVPLSKEEELASLVSGALYSIEWSNGYPNQKRDWLDELERAVRIDALVDRLSAIIQLQNKIPDALGVDRDPTFDPRGPRPGFGSPHFPGPRGTEDRRYDSLRVR
jgi:hypothetical protein